jgi:hypothetical protein
MFAAAQSARPKTWNSVEDEYLQAIERLDDNLVAGIADMGDLQNGKGDFFNDLLALILEGCGEVPLYSRRLVPGFIYPTHNLDITYPGGADDVARFVVEAKAVGTPKHAGSPRERAIGRPGSMDIRKRVAELAFKTIDLKAEHGRIEAMLGRRPTVNPGGNLTTWLRGASPRTYLFVSARVVSETDLQGVVTYADRATQVLDGVGLFCYEPVSESHPTTYRPVTKGIPTSLRLDRVLYRACEDLTAIMRETSVKLPGDVVRTALETEELGRIDEP